MTREPANIDKLWSLHTLETRSLLDYTVARGSRIRGRTAKYIRYLSFLYDTIHLTVLIILTVILAYAAMPVIQTHTAAANQAINTCENECLTTLHRDEYLSALHGIGIYYEILLAILIFAIEAMESKTDIRSILSSPNPYWLQSLVRRYRLRNLESIIEFENNNKPRSLGRAVLALRIFSKPEYLAVSDFIIRYSLVILLYIILAVYILEYNIIVPTGLIVLGGILIGLPIVFLIPVILLSPARNILAIIDNEWYRIFSIAKVASYSYYPREPWKTSISRMYRVLYWVRRILSKLGLKAGFYIKSDLERLVTGILIVYLLHIFIIGSYLHIDINNPDMLVISTLRIAGVSVFVFILYKLVITLQDWVYSRFYQYTLNTYATTVLSVITAFAILSVPVSVVLYLYFHPANLLLDKSVQGAFQAYMLTMKVLLTKKQFIALTVFSIALLLTNSKGVSSEVKTTPRTRIKKAGETYPLQSFISYHATKLADILSSGEQPEKLNYYLEDTARILQLDLCSNIDAVTQLIKPVICKNDSDTRDCRDVKNYESQPNPYLVDNDVISRLTQFTHDLLQQHEKKQLPPPPILGTIIAELAVIAKLRTITKRPSFGGMPALRQAILKLDKIRASHLQAFNSVLDPDKYQTLIRILQGLIPEVQIILAGQTGLE